MSDRHLCNLFGVYIGFEQEPDHRCLAFAETDVTLFSWDVPAILHMASGAASVAVPAYWRSFLLNVLALQYHRCVCWQVLVGMGTELCKWLPVVINGVACTYYFPMQKSTVLYCKTRGTFIKARPYTCYTCTSEEEQVASMHVMHTYSGIIW